MSDASGDLIAIRQKNNAYMAAWRAKNRVRINKKQNEKYATDPVAREVVKKRASKWYAENKARALKRAAAHYAKNKETIKARVKEYRQKNPVTWRAYFNLYLRARRAKIKERTIGTIDIERIIAKAGGKCGICSGDLGGKFEFDHIFPIAKGGAHTADNLQLAHSVCNKMKGAKINYYFPVSADG